MSSNANEVIRAVLNFLFIYFFFLLKDFAAPKAPKAPKAQRSDQAKEEKRK